MPNLENLKKQAKLYLRWHRDRYYPVAAQLREFLPRFRHLNDRNALSHSFTLADAQELVARKHGFESWAALRTGVSDMANHAADRQAQPMLIAAEPQLFVTDVAAAIAYYTAKLGFTTVFTYGEPLFYGQVVRDGARLNLRFVPAPVIDPEYREREQLLSATITLDDAKPLFLEFQAACVDFHQTLRTEPWGARTFVVRDPDGNLILFAGGMA